MSKFSITASLNGQSQTHYFETGNKWDAMMWGANYVMTFARNDDGPVELWAKGAIILRNEDTGEIVKTMEAK